MTRALAPMTELALAAYYATALSRATGADVERLRRALAAVGEGPLPITDHDLREAARAFVAQRENPIIPVHRPTRMAVVKALDAWRVVQPAPHPVPTEGRHFPWQDRADIA